MNKERLFNDKVQIHSDIIHFLPFSTSKVRREHFFYSGKYGENTISVRANETLNMDDFIVFLQLIKVFQDNLEHLEKGGYKGKGEYKRDTFSFSLNTKKMLLEKGISNHIKNRKTIFQSLERLMGMTLKVISPTDITVSQLIFSVNTDLKYNNIEVFLNKDYLSFCLSYGIFINYKRLFKYNSNYTKTLDAYLQGTKTKTKKINRKYKNKEIFGYEYKKQYKQDEISKVLKLGQFMDAYKKLEKVKDTFNEFNKKNGEGIVYEYNKIENRWELK